MASFFDKVRDAIFDPEPVDEEMLMEEGRMENETFEGEDVFEERDRRRTGSGKVVNMDKPNLTAVQGASTIKMILYQPMSFEDSTAIVDNLRARKPVIVNMVDLERECAQRVLDFMAGAVYALNGTIRRVSYGIFVIVPSNVAIVGNSEDEERELFRN